MAPAKPDFGLFSDVTDALCILCFPLDLHMSQGYTIQNHLVICGALKGGGPGDLLPTCAGPLQILFSSHITEGVIFTGEQTWVCCHSRPWHRTSVRSHLKAGFYEWPRERPDAEIVRIKRNICVRKVLRCSLFFIYYYNNTIRGKNPWHNFLLSKKLRLHLHLLFMQRPCALRGDALEYN